MIDDKAKFVSLLRMLAQKTNYALTEQEIAFYMERLAETPIAAVNQALMNFLENAHTLRGIPSIGQIKEALGQKTPSVEDLAREIAVKIEAAIGKFGYPNEGDALEFIGPLGREIIRDLGGWRGFCMGIDSYDQMPSIRKQLRELAEAKLRRVPETERQALLPPSSRSVPVAK